MERIDNDQNFDRIEHNGGRTYIILGYVFAALSLIFQPIVFGILGVIMGVVANRKGSKGTLVIILSVVLALSGMIINALIMAFFKTFLGVMTIIY
ncbi:hypothetical protein [Petroclostridium sp. X23]|uniref:hypothetical protein n=1 Tax=Petroclostridium sp. X23 TaxID=3045146 RepID=UPI0024ADF82C|nr:hypothetical protein [Petroclostridium sp. X23]WHH57382.1 hypothetical protein QKW49_16285 [Petroclostridium sp. X23]